MYVPVTGIVLEGHYFEAECDISFRGNVAPVMTWSGPDVFNLQTQTTNVSVWSEIGFTVTKAMNAGTFTCVTNFTQTGFIKPDSATNIPTYTFTFRGTNLDVRCKDTNFSLGCVGCFGGLDYQ